MERARMETGVERGERGEESRDRRESQGRSRGTKSAEQAGNNQGNAREKVRTKPSLVLCSRLFYQSSQSEGEERPREGAFLSVAAFGRRNHAAAGLANLSGLPPRGSSRRSRRASEPPSLVRCPHGLRVRVSRGSSAFMDLALSRWTGRP